MRFNIRGNKVTVTDAIKSYIEEKIGKLDKYFEHPDDLTAYVLLKVTGVNQTVEVTIPVKKIILRGEEHHKDLYAAIDLVSDKIERQIRKNKTRMHKKVNKVNFDDFNLNFEPEEGTDEAKVVKRKVIEMKPMDEEEAILQMNLLGHEFFIFKNVKSEEISILYRRKDGDYGIIETK